jgi:hypothetical protein
MLDAPDEVGVEIPDLLGPLVLEAVGLDGLVSGLGMALSR